MITGSAEYKEYLAKLTNSYNPPNILLRIPADEPIYEVNLETRTITPPKFLGVEADHEAEIIYFIMDRFYDNIDLSQCIGAIQFENAKHEEYIYIIPAYDLASSSGKIIFGWNIQSPVTKYGGTVQFSFKFFKIDKTSGELLYELNTLVCKTKVLIGWATKNGANHKYNQFTVDEILTDPSVTFEYDENNNIKLDSNGSPIVLAKGYGIWSKIQEIYDANKKFNIYWLDADKEWV